MAFKILRILGKFPRSDPGDYLPGWGKCCDAAPAIKKSMSRGGGGGGGGGGGVWGPDTLIFFYAYKKYI